MEQTTRIIGAGKKFDETGKTSDMPSEPFAVIITIHVKPDCVQEFLRILSQVADAVRLPHIHFQIVNVQYRR